MVERKEVEEEDKESNGKTLVKRLTNVSNRVSLYNQDYKDGELLTFANVNSKKEFSERRKDGDKLDLGCKHLQTLTINKVSERETNCPTLGFRVSWSVYGAYRKLGRRRKMLVRDALEALILAISEDSKINPLTTPQIFNININMAKSEVRTQPSIDPSILQEKIRMLEEENRELRQLLRFYKEKFEKVRTQIAQLNLNITTKYDLESLLQKLRGLKEEFVRTQS